MNVALLELLRRLALNDEGALGEVMSGHAAACPPLDDKAVALIKVAGMVGLEAGDVSMQTAVDAAHAAGAEDEEIIDVLRAVVHVIGVAKLNATAPTLAMALGYQAE